jgi:hypothetical protein
LDPAWLQRVQQRSPFFFSGSCICWSADAARAHAFISPIAAVSGVKGLSSRHFRMNRTAFFCPTFGSPSPARSLPVMIANAMRSLRLSESTPSSASGISLSSLASTTAERLRIVSHNLEFSRFSIENLVKQRLQTMTVYREKSIDDSAWLVERTKCLAFRFGTYDGYTVVERLAIGKLSERCLLRRL